VPTVERAGVRIYYEEHGPRGPEAPALLLTHGFSATLRMWDSQIEALESRWHVVRWDMRGHGQSDSPEDPAAYTHKATFGDMVAVLDACGVDRAVIGGLSLGGYMSLELYLAHPERVRALVLCDTGPGYKKDDARAAWNRYAESFAQKFDEKGLAALGPSAEVKIAKHRDARGLALAARGILVQRDARVIESLPSISVPTLLVVGSEDRPFLTGMKYMAEKIPDAEHVVIEGAGHAVNIDQPARFNAVLVAFLDRVSEV
jgi:pimeloyl-ACP methyl ester carboxylesterase